MSTLIVGFDSAWTAPKSGGLVGVIIHDNGDLHEIGPPQRATFLEAEAIISDWQATWLPSATTIMLDQPTIVPNSQGQRPVENIVASPVSLRKGGVQPANTSRDAMFGPRAPVWSFLDRFGGPANPLNPTSCTQVYETYPVLTLIALGWILPDTLPAGRLPKYNPDRRKTFSVQDWQHVCDMLFVACNKLGLEKISIWIKMIRNSARPGKGDQDCLDACICLLVALHLSHNRACLMIGDQQSGYMVVPANPELISELETRCVTTGRTPDQWVRLLGAK